MPRYLEAAREAATEAANVALRYYSEQIDVEVKSDRSPVTIADRMAEKVIIETISKYFPNHAFYGEETGSTGPKSDFTWIIDPIDGTKNFIAKIPLWGILIALKHRNDIILGLSYMPMLNELLWAEKRKGAFLNGQRVRVSNTRAVHKSMLSFGSLGPFRTKEHDAGLMELISDCLRQRSFGDLWPYHLLASGKLDIVAEAAIKAFDVAPFVRIIAEAGGHVSDLDGDPFGMNIGSFLATNGALYKKVLPYFAKRSTEKQP